MLSPWERYAWFGDLFNTFPEAACWGWDLFPGAYSYFWYANLVSAPPDGVWARLPYHPLTVTPTPYIRWAPDTCTRHGPPV